MTKAEVFYGFGHIHRRNPSVKPPFLWGVLRGFIRLFDGQRIKAGWFGVLTEAEVNNLNFWRILSSVEETHFCFYRKHQEHNFSQVVMIECFWYIYPGYIYFLVWSREACKIFPGKLVGTVSCEYTHLTSFTLMVDIDQSGSNPLSLEIITWMGCEISLFGFVLKILT